MLTLKEKAVLRLLMVSYKVDYSINQIAHECGLTPNGAFKILGKFEREGILKPHAISNIKSYKLDFTNPKTAMVLELALMSDIKGKIRYRQDDFEGLKQIAKACILFGSYINSKTAPNDMDVLFILDKSNFKKYVSVLNSIKETAPLRIHDVVQTEGDLRANIIKRDRIILDVLRKGIILWGHGIIIKEVRNAYQG